MADNTVEVIVIAKDQATSVFSKLGNLFLGGGVFGAGLAVANKLIGAVTGSIGDWVGGALEAQNVQAQLNSVLEATGGVAGVTAQMANELASSLMGVTRFEDEAILSGENLLLTFKGIGADVFPAATEAMLDMSTAMGQDIKSSAIQLGKALNDPLQGMTALTRVGVTFTEEQKKAIEAMMKTGDIAGAQKVILDELASEFGGAAKAAGETFAGQMDILKNSLNDVAEGIVGSVLPAGQQIITDFVMPLLPAIQDLATQVGEWLTGVALPALMDFADWFVNIGWPAVQTFLAPILAELIPGLQQLGAWIIQIAQAVLPSLAQAIQFVIDHFNIFGPILGVIAVLILALTSPITLVIGAIVLFATAWANNWGGIRDVLTNVWNNFLGPIFTAIYEWYKDRLVFALNFWTDTWNNVFWPAIQTVWGWIQTNLFPLFEDLFGWLATHLPEAIQTVSDFWTGTLQPALNAVWGFIDANLIPLFKALGELLGVTLKLVLTVLAGVWQNVLKPALEAVWKFIQANVMPIIEDLAEAIGERLQPVIKVIAAFLSDNLAGAFRGISNAIQGVIGWINELITALKNVKLPDFLTPGSPTPFEMGLRGIADAMASLNSVHLPSFAMRMALAGGISPAGRAAAAGNTFNMTVYSNAPTEPILSDFASMQSWWRG